MQKWLMTFYLVTAFVRASAQEPEDHLLPKVAPHLHALYYSQKASAEKNVYWIATNSRDSLFALFVRYPFSFKILREYSRAGFVVVESAWDLVKEELLPKTYVTFIDAPRQPHEEFYQKRFDSHVNNINRAHREYPSITGKNNVLSIKENRLDSLDIDIRGRFQSTSLASNFTTTHAAAMATLAAGAGNSFYTGKGVAFEATVGSSNFANLLPEAETDYLRYGITVQNHSYGTGIENYYGADAAAYDASVMAIPSLVPVFSAGNAGTQVAGQGRYAGLPNRANLTGSFKMAKNILTVGAIDSFYHLETLSSRGPAYDGRVKPELVAFGEDGSSGAAALTSGAALLVQHYYRSQQGGAAPPAALTRAVLINGADDLETPGPDFNTGFGNLNVAHTLNILHQKQYITDSISQNTTQVYPIQIPANCHQLKITLSWSDPPAAANSPKSLVNDLDLVLLQNDNATVWLPWVLNTSPHPDSLNAMAIRGRDTINNNEQLTLNHPPAGPYSIRIKANALNALSQSFAIAWDITRENDWEWVSPIQGDGAIPGQPFLLRWQSALDVSTGVLEYQLIGSANWITIGSVNLNQGWLKWNTPDTSGMLQFRMLAKGNTFLSDTITLTHIPKLKTGMDCPDSILLYWNSIPGVDHYRIYSLGERNLVPLKEVRDSFALLSKNAFTGEYFSVAPLLPSGQEATRSISINYTLQGVSCYFRSFLVDLTAPNSAQIRFQLGTTYRIAYLEIEKWKNNRFTALTKLDQITTDEVRYSDQDLVKGANTYRLKITLTDGRTVYSSRETIYYLANENYLLFPNPVSRSYGRLTIVSQEFLDSHLQVLDIQGRIVYNQSLNSNITHHYIGGLPAGVYIIKLFKEGEAPWIQRLVIQ